MPAGFEVEGVVAVVKVCEFGEEGELVLGVEFRVCMMERS